MKKYILYVLSIALMVPFLWSCEKDEHKVFLTEGTPPVLKANTNEIVLDNNKKESVVLNLSWTNPNYGFTTGVSSHNVNYIIEVDVAGNDFANPNNQMMVVNNDLGTALTVKQINSHLINNLKVDVDKPLNIELRVKSSMSNNSAPLASNVLKYTVTPFIDVKIPLPATGELWVTGDAFASGWSNPLGDPYLETQKFTRVTDTKFELVVDFVGGGGYKVLQKMGDWSTQYHATGSPVWNAGEFELKDADPQFPGTPEAGKYKITLDFVAGTYTVVKV